MPSSSGQTANSTADVLTSIPSQMLESFVPGFGIISRFLEVSLGIDITAIVSILFIIAAFAGALGYAGRTIWRAVKTSCTSQIMVLSSDKLYEQLMYWISQQDFASQSRALRATTTKEKDEGSGQGRRGQSDGLSNFYFAGIEAATPPEYTPAFGWHRFWYKGSMIFLERSQDKTQMIDFTGWGPKQGEKETVTLSCLGWSSRPLKRLLMDCKQLYAERHRSTTIVRRTAPGQQAYWIKAIRRPSRSIDTVFMDEKVKAELMEDVREYLHPSAPVFYARRGIPYRRGYLFYGPPGTGKTSLSFALAGTFGFELFSLSLKEPFMSEHKLTQLFSSLPSRCIVLLEDIDSAGLEKREDTKKDKSEQEGEEDKDKDKKNDEQSDKGGVRIRNETRHYGNTSISVAAAEGVTLSGLLNAIDGVASQEGRILVMTTNDPEALDRALIRPGRVDKQVYFGSASQYHIRQIFYQMFAGDDQERLANGKAHHDGEKHSTSSTELGKLTSNDLEKMATTFADMLPETTFSPAEIQGFLLMRRKSPQKAIEEVPKWRDALLAARRAGKNVIEEAKDEDSESPKGSSKPDRKPQDERNDENSESSEDHTKKNGKPQEEENGKGLEKSKDSSTLNGKP